MIGIDVRWPQLRHVAFVGGLCLSALAALVLLLSAYFAGTAPHMPSTAEALETLKTGSGWPAPVTSRSLGANGALSSLRVSSSDVSLLPRSADPSEAPPIDISDLPPAVHRLR